MATGATTFISNTTATAFIDKIYSKMAIVAREAAVVFADLVNRKFESEAGYGDTVSVPSVTNMTTQTLTPGTAGGAIQSTCRSSSRCRAG